MKPEITFNDMVGFLQTQKINLTLKQTDQLSNYYKLLMQWKNKTNLISSNDYNAILERHFITSFYYGFILINEINQTDRIVDMGTGAGFPGIILSILFPDHCISLIDSSRKKALFLNLVKKNLGLVNCNIVNDRIENLFNQNNLIVKYIMARALAPLPKLIELAKSFIEDDSRLFTIKGADFKNSAERNFLNNKQIQIIPIYKPWLEFSSYMNHKILIEYRF
ncbi:MAG: 16S rRNA (guanine(527)-N(7))-methyltransferase RsmG [Calditrichaeota bacterium]|nr:MAG: 16S rRNA (guanine(527)-N(7))-methyltransferase RsmG [Calditrichota bacterium]